MKEIKKQEISERCEPFKSGGSVAKIKRGEYKNQKVKKIIVEIISIESVGNCYQVKVQVSFNTSQNILGYQW